MKKITSNNHKSKTTSEDTEEKLSPEAIRALNKSYTRSQPPYLLYVLIGALSLFSFYMYTQVQSLKKGTNNVAAAQGGNNQPPPPTQDLKALPEISDKDHIRGSRDADVVIVEYSDYECPFCKSFHPTMQQVMKDYGDKVSWVYRHYPLSFHPKAQKTAEATECANELGGNDAFWQLTDLIFEKMPAMELTELPTLASEIGLDQDAFKQCLDSGKYAKHINEDMAGGTKTGVNGTPGAVIVGKNGKREFIGGAMPFDQVKPLIDKVLQ